MRFLTALILGAGIVVFFAAAHALGLDTRWEELSLDLRYRITSQTQLSDELRLLLLDDTSLETLGRWPWPRRTQAGVIQALADAGSSIVALDILLPDPQEVRYISDRWDVYDPGEHFVGLGTPRPVFDDQELQEALARPDPLLLPVVMNPTQSRLRIGPKATRLVRLLHKQPQASLEQARKLLEESGQEMDGKDLAQLYLYARSLQKLRSRLALPVDAFGHLDCRAGRPTGALERFLQQADAVGFVNFFPDEDGKLRRMPLVMADSQSNKCFLQMGLALAGSYLEKTHQAPCRIRSQPGSIVLQQPGRPTLRIPVDSQGQILVPWIRHEDFPDPAKISLARPGIIYLNRQALQRNLRYRRLLQEDLADKLDQQELLAAFSRLRKLEQRRDQQSLQLQRKMLYQPQATGPLEPIREQIRQIQERIESLAGELSDPFYLQGLAPEDPTRLEIEALLGRIEQTEESNRLIGREIQLQLADLRKHVEGKVCLIGAEATTLGDFVPTPSTRRLPGVYVHANLFSAITRGDFIRHPGLRWDLAVILILGLLAVGISVRLPVLWAGGLVSALIGLYILFNAYVLFAWNGIRMALVSPASGAFLGFVFVTVYRELTEEREKRRIRAMFSNAISATMVDRLLENPDIARLGGGERRCGTFFFSDLHGFTGLVEKIGERRAVEILNEVFDRATDIIEQRNGGYLNKFLGDGVFAMFGAPVAWEDHPRRAVQAALDCCSELEAFSRELPGRLGIETDLHCRIGLAGGEVMIGNCGSSRRWDISAIGDAVNLASRLEGASKLLGTRNLVADDTYQQAIRQNEDFLARPLGPIRVVGRQEPVRVWNLLGRRSQCSPEILQLALEFTEAFQLHDQHQHSKAAEAFDRLCRKFPEDTPCRILRDWARQSDESPPGSDVPDIIELRQKGQ